VVASAVTQNSRRDKKGNVKNVGGVRRRSVVILWERVKIVHGRREIMMMTTSLSTMAAVLFAISILLERKVPSVILIYAGGQAGVLIVWVWMPMISVHMMRRRTSGSDCAINVSSQGHVTNAALGTVSRA